TGVIYIFRGVDPNGRPKERFTFASGLSQPFGMAFAHGYFYVADTDAVLRFPYRDGQTKAETKPDKIIALTEGGYRQHWTRDIAFAPDGKKMYVTIGSGSNDSTGEDPRRAAINEYDPDGSHHRIFASGLRNAVGIAFDPKTGQLWAAVNERDGLGDD